MMTLPMVQKPIIIVLIILLIVGQLAFVAQFLLVPKPAKAFWGIGDFNFSTIVANWADVIQRIAQGALMRIAQAYSNKYLTRFVDKLQDKYKIRNFLYYDKYLSNYYLTDYILKNVSDPDLRQAFDLMTRAVITGETGGYTGVGTDPTKALIPKLKSAIYKLYQKSGGVPTSAVIAKPPNTSSTQYFNSLSSYYSFTPSYVEQNLQGQFGAMQSAATTAAQLEVIVGNGLKAGRVIGGTCAKDDSVVTGSGLPDETTGGDQASAPATIDAKDPVACVAQGGKWQASLVDQARSFISNPTSMVSHFAENALNSIFSTNYDPTNIWTAVGSALGNYVFNQLNMDKDDGTFNETGSSDNDYKGDSGNTPRVKELDKDADNVPDGQTSDGRTLEVCYHGGVAPDCTLSSQVPSSPYFTPICNAIDSSVTALAIYAEFIDTHADLMKGGGSLKGKVIGLILGGPVGAILGGLFTTGSVDDFVNKADADIWAKRSNLANSAVEELINAINTYNSKYWDNSEIVLNRYANYMSKVIQSLQKDGDLDLSTFGSGGGGLENLMKNTGYILRYIKELKIVIGKCEDPNIRAVDAVPTPTIGGGDDSGEGVPPPDDALQKHPDQSGVVAAVKAELMGAPLNMVFSRTSPECPDRFAITKRVAWQLRDTGAGLLDKPTGNNCQGYAVDIIAFPDGYIYDILSGGAPDGNGPIWNPVGCGTSQTNGTCPQRYRPAISP